MKWIILFTLSAASNAQAAVKSSYTLSLGQKSEATLYWQHRSVKNKNIFVIGHHGTNGLHTEQVIPKDEFQRNIQDLKNWRTKLINKRSVATAPGCDDAVIFGTGKGIVPVCLQSTPRDGKAEFLRWYIKKVDLITGRL